MQDSCVRGRLLELSSKNRHSLESIDTRIIASSSLSPEYVSTESVRVLTETREIIMRPIQCGTVLWDDIYSSYSRKTSIIWNEFLKIWH